MKVLRKVGKFELNKGDMQAQGLYNLTNESLLRSTTDKGCSSWFDGERKNELMIMSDSEFIQVAEEETI